VSKSTTTILVPSRVESCSLKQQQKSAPPMCTACHCTQRVLLQLFVLLFSSLFLILLRFFELRATSIEARISSPHAAPRRSAQRGRVMIMITVISEAVPGPRSRHAESSRSRFASEKDLGIDECQVMSTPDSCRINFDFQSFLFSFVFFYPDRHVPVPYVRRYWSELTKPRGSALDSRR
jgi:hypothetical protein